MMGFKQLSSELELLLEIIEIINSNCYFKKNKKKRLSKFVL